VRERNTLKPANSIAGLAGAAVLSPQQHAMASNIPDATNHAVLREMGTAVMSGDRMGTLHGMSLDSSAAPRDDAFAALDAARTSPSASWIHAGVHHAEAGYLDPGLGWISVRADAVGGGVHAAVVPGSAEAAQALDGHLVGLNAYLAGQHQRATTVTMDAPQSGPDTAMNHGQGGGEGNANQQNSEQERRTLMGESMRGTGTTTQVRPEREAAGPGKPVSIGGSHISVLA
jgi:hypothetical protein